MDGPREEEIKTKRFVEFKIRGHEFGGDSNQDVDENDQCIPKSMFRFEYT